MSMTAEEAIKQIEKLKSYCEYMADSDESGAYLFDLDGQALDLAISALRPITREQVEKVWDGCELCRRSTKVIGFAYAEGPSEKVPGEKFQAAYVGGFESNSKEAFCKLRFCPSCGRPLTDEAVDMVMERWKETVDA